MDLDQALGRHPAEPRRLADAAAFRHRPGDETVMVEGVEVESLHIHAPYGRHEKAEAEREIAETADPRVLGVVSPECGTVDAQIGGWD
jgi:hypothetical protein